LEKVAAKQTINKWRLLVDCLRAGWNVVRMPGRSHRGPLPPPDERLLATAAEIRRYVAELAENIGERNVRHRPRELAQAADYISAELAGAGYTVQRQEYTVDGQPCANLEVEIPGGTRASEIVVIGAHYDSVPDCPAANDNASGVAALLCLAKTFAASRGARTLRFVAFVNEEAPYAHTQQMGSWVYARRCRERDENVTAMLSLETIGFFSDEPHSQKYPARLGWLYPSTGDFIAFVGNTRYGRLVREVVRAFRKIEPFPSQGGAMPEAISDIGRSDHWPFWQEGYPALMVTDTAPFRYPHYHTPEDTVDKLDFERTARVVRGLEGVLRALVAAR
jgi:Zn-dependent M28 family amino/carboxypeptidase